MTERIRRFQPIALVLLLIGAPGQAEQLLVSAAEFHARKEVGHFFNPDGWVEGQLTGGGDGCLVAPVHLPHDARIHSILFQVFDNRAENFRVDLKRKLRGNSAPAEAIAGIGTSGASGALQQGLVVLPGDPHLVQDAFVYFLSTEGGCLAGANHRIYAVRFNYTLPIFADDFESGDTSAWGVPPQTEFSAWVSGADFQNYAGWPWTIDTTLAAFWIENANDLTPPCAMAPLELPEGATVTGLRGNLWDVRGDRNVTLNIRRSRMNSSTVAEPLATASTSGSSGWQLRSDFTISNGVIDNDTYWYWIDLCLTGGNTLEAAQIGVQAAEVLYSLP